MLKKAINQFIEFFYFGFLKFIPIQTFKYLFCGGTTVLVDYLVYYFTYYFLFEGNLVVFYGKTLSPHVASSILSFLVSFPLGFALNKYIAFTESSLRGHVQLFRYGLIVLSCFIFSLFFIKLFVEFFHLNPYLSKVLTIITVAIYSYYSQLYFSFKVRGKTKEKV
ncbi:MAG TPA: GtrA family protein [Chitinophagaceae bacterium]|nr:MAG: GtrA family protein [Bacteroidetes bacterium OLB11]HMN32972.1 GtrA family protein [Chitinophagaceae bacterium]